MRLRDRHYRQPGLTDQRQVREARIRLDVGQGDRLWQGSDRLQVDAYPVAGFGGRVGIGFASDLDDADDLLADVGVIEERAVAQAHGFQVVPRRMVPHSGPWLNSVRDLLVP